MRPLRLTLRGLRSYRALCEIDFKDAGLVAIMGDTGAGKSSILEAITYALYNATSWDQRSVKQLIADGEQTVTVIFDFIADEQVWRVTRSASRTNYPPSVHKLECLSESVPWFDGEGAVNAKIQRLVGLDWRAFGSAIILPQGRFQTLLQATPSDRTAILKGIFRLDELEAVRQQADELARTARPLIDKLRSARAQLLPDPTTTAKDAENRRKRAAQVERVLRKALAALRQAEEAARTADRQAATFEGFTAGIERHVLGAPQQLRMLIPIAHEIERKEKAIRREQRKLQQTESGLADQLAEAEGADEGLEALARAEQILDSLKRTDPQLKAETERLKLEQQSLVTSEEELARAAAAATESQKRAEKAEMTAAAANGKALAAQARLIEARQRLLAYREAAVARDDHLKWLSELDNDVEVRRTTLDQAQAKQKQAERVRDEARASLEAVQQAHSAVHAAQGLASGDPCPICARPLPASFEPPPWPEQGGAEKALDVAEKKLIEAQTHVATARAEVRQCERTIAEGRRKQGELVGKANESIRALSELTPGADVNSPDDEVLAPLAREEAAHIDQATSLQQAAKDSRRAADRADAELVPRRQALGRRRQDFERDRKMLERNQLQCESDRRRIPDAVRPVAPLTVDGVQAACEQVGARLANLRRVEKELRQIRDGLRNLSERASELDQERRKTLERPRHQAEKALALLVERVNEGATALERPLIISTAEGLPLEQAASQADQLERSAVALIEELTGAAQDSRQRAEASRTAAKRVLEDVGAANEQTLEESLISAAATVKEAEMERDRARAQEPKAANLDRRIGEGQRFLASLEELTRLVTDGRFIGHVVGRKQRALLVVASEILGEMTGRRYGFSEDFQIVDRLSGQPRSVRTLSGGETFLASLALALGLVELAGRSGGRLEALFLDEGFGSLDANALDEALAELERRASAGRLVRVISHVRAVAERIETVLSVSRTSAGSEARWISGSERDLLIEEELEEGLLQ